MSMLARLATMGGAAAATYVDDVFSAWTRSGTGASATITTGIDLSTKGGLVITKARSTATGWRYTDTARGVQTSLDSSATGGNATESTGLTAFGTTGYTIGADTDYNDSTGPVTYVDFTFRNAAKFFSHATVTKSAGSNATASFTDLATLGMVSVRRTDSSGSWYVWHRSLTAGKLLYLEQTAAEATLGHITVSGTTVTLVNGTIADGSYVVYAWAHDTAADGIVQCGSFTTDGSGNATVNLGWEPQWILKKSIAGTYQTGQWIMQDSMRGMDANGNFARLFANLSNAESQGSGTTPNASGFGNYEGASTTYIYLAIRRPNKPPTTGTQVYNAIARTGTGAAATVTGVGFAPDLLLGKSRGTVGGYGFAPMDRLRGTGKFLVTDIKAGEYAATDTISSFNMDGATFGVDTNTAQYNYSGTYITNFFRRAPGVFDVVCDSGTGSAHTVNHNLTASPELWLRKGRSGSTTWVWGSSLLANTEKIVMPSPAGKVTDANAWNSTYPTSTVFTVGTLSDVNTNTATYVTYLWATLAGVSKVGTFTGNGSSQTINCGFSAGARFALIIRTTASTSQDIFVWDSTRGIVAGNDPHLSLNTSAAEVTSDDSLDPDASGFIVNQVAATNINVNGAVYIYLAYS